MNSTDTEHEPATEPEPHIAERDVAAGPGSGADAGSTVERDVPAAEAESSATPDAELDQGSGAAVDVVADAKRRALVVTVAALAAVVVFAVAGGVLWVVRAHHEHQARDDAITVAAREEVLALLTLNQKDVKGSLDKVLAGATGGWRERFAQEADQFTQVVQKQHVDATATITASAIQSADDTHATVLVAADAEIRNTNSPQGYPGVYRILMNLQSQDGVWLVSDLQFVA